MQSMSVNVIYNKSFTDNDLDACDNVLCEDVRSTQHLNENSLMRHILSFPHNQLIWYASQKSHHSTLCSEVQFTYPIYDAQSMQNQTRS